MKRASFSRSFLAAGSLVALVLRCGRDSPVVMRYEAAAMIESDALR
jgi:hypothetical protein